jgi:DNA replication and repair protein RecF
MPPHPAFVARLRLTDFRNHAALTLEPGCRSVVLVGDNGVGKTNVLEALSLLTPGRGLRRAARSEMARRGGPGTFAIVADAEGALGPVRIGTGDDGETQRVVTIDGERQRQQEILSAHLRVVWLTPAMDGLFTGSAGDRRRWLDRAVLAVDPSHGRRVMAFEQALTQRNRLLEDLRVDAAWLDAVEAQIAGLAVAVAAARRDLVDCLAASTPAAGAFPAFPVPRVALEGDVEGALATAAASDVEDWYRVDLRSARSRDRAAGRTLVGPHRADLAVFHAGKDMPAALSSTGEQKALLLGLTLAQARLVGDLAGIAPLLLLDEVAAHLDAGRREALFQILEDLGGQAWMTGTEEAPFAGLTGRAVVLKPVPGEP